MSEHAARKCGGKKRYKSERRAEAAAQRTQHFSSVPMTYYECEYCKGWHVGSVEVHERVAHQLPRKMRYLREVTL